MTHYLDDLGRIPDLPAPAMRLALYFGSIVESVTSCSPGGSQSSGVRCRRRPGRRRCEGEIRAILDARTHEVLWSCPVCGDNGVIHHWEGTPWDTRPDRPQTVGSRASMMLPEPRSKEDSTTPSFTARAVRLWRGLDSAIRVRLLNNVWCSNCGVTRSMQLLGGREEDGDLVLNGRCLICGGEVARLVESG